MGLVKGVCGNCGSKIQRDSPVPMVVTCPCYKKCPLCGAEMTPYTPDLSPGTYRAEDDYDPLGVATKSEATIETLFVCKNHEPPYYSSQMPVEVQLT